jgi:hypothetical protein
LVFLDLYVLRGGFAAMCGRCFRNSPSIQEAEKATAWAELMKLGWTVYRSTVVPTARPYAVCPTCTRISSRPPP